MTAIAPSPLNPRKRLDQEALAELAASIQQHGLMEPIVVRPRPFDAVADEHRGASWLIVAGERRWRAAKLAGLETIPCSIRADLSDNDALQLALIENLHRSDLDPIDEAEGYAQLNRVVGMTQAQIAAAVNRSQPGIANTMRLLELPDAVRALVSTGKLSPAHGRALVKYAKWPGLCQAVAAYAIDAGMTSKQLEADIGANWAMKRVLGGQGLLREIDDGDLRGAGLDRKALEAAGATIFGKGEWEAWTPDVELIHRLHREATKDAEAEKNRRFQELHDRMKAEGKEAIRLKTLNYGDYEQITTYSRPPEGCGSDCPCRTAAIDRGGAVVEICTDPKRYRRLSTAAARAENKERHTQAKEKAAELDAILAAAPALDPRGLAIVAADHIWRVPKAVGKRLITEFASAVLDPKVLDDYMAGGRRDTYGQLAQLPAETLVQILVHGALLDDVTRYQQYGAMPATLVWYMEGAGVELLPTDPAELKRRIKEAKAKIADIAIQNQPGLCAQWQATRKQLEERFAEVRRG